MAARFAFRLVAMLGLVVAGGASAADLPERCLELAQQVKINVDFQDRVVVTDESRNVEALNGLSGKPAGGGHHVYGLTHANPSIQLTVVPRAIAMGDGRFCAMPDISLALGFSDFVVYLARELTDECRRSVIREHEQEHVNTWRSHLRASARMLTTILRRDVGEPRVYASREEVVAGVRAWGGELVTPWAKRILDGVVEAQKSIDTPASYAGVVSRLRACPPVRGRGN